MGHNSRAIDRERRGRLGLVGKYLSTFVYKDLMGQNPLTYDRSGRTPKIYCGVITCQKNMKKKTSRLILETTTLTSYFSKFVSQFMTWGVMGLSQHSPFLSLGMAQKTKTCLDSGLTNMNPEPIIPITRYMSNSSNHIHQSVYQLEMLYRFRKVTYVCSNSNMVFFTICHICLTINFRTLQ